VFSLAKCLLSGNKKERQLFLDLQAVFFEMPLMEQPQNISTDETNNEKTFG